MKTLEDIKLRDILSDGIRRDANVLACADAIDPELQAVARAADTSAIFANIDRLTSAQLDHIAYGFDSAVWRDSWPVTLKRSMLRKIIKEKRLRGTVSAVRDALSAVQSYAKIVEWWQMTPKGTPHTFKIYVTQTDVGGVVTADMQNDIIALIDDAKPLRSHYDLTIQRAVSGGMGVKAVARAATFSRLTGGL